MQSLNPEKKPDLLRKCESKKKFDTIKSTNKYLICS